MADRRGRREDWVFGVGTSVVRAMERVVDILEEEEDEDEVQSSSPKTRRQILRDRAAANEQLMRHYFNEDCLYPAEVFRRRFRMKRPLFLRIVNDVSEISDYIRQTCDARGVHMYHIT